jgi:hypothetical protein
MKDVRIILLCICGSIFMFFSFPVLCRAEDNYPEQKITACDSSCIANFGRSVSISKNHIIVGSFGAAYIFKNQAGKWVEVAKLEPDDGIFHGQFGRSVAITDNYAVIGDWDDTDNGEGAGAAYIFQYSNDSWTQLVKLTASDGTALDRFGEPLSVTDKYVIIGATGDDDYGKASGAAYIFTRNGNTWIETAKLVANDISADDHFGCGISMTNNYAIIGSHSEAAYIFKCSNNLWIETAKLVADDATKDDHFGCNVAITDHYAVVGAHGNDDYGQYSGSAYIFKRNTDTWTQVAKLTPKDATAYDGFGSCVSLTDKSAVIGSFLPETGNGSGFAYLFRYNGKDWIQTAKLQASDAIDWDAFGSCVSTTDKYTVIGASDNHPGSAYVYKIGHGQLSQ